MDAVLATLLEHQSFAYGANVRDSWMEKVHLYYQYCTMILSFSSSLSILRDLTSASSSSPFYLPSFELTVFEDSEYEEKDAKPFGMCQLLDLHDPDLIASMMRPASLYIWPLDNDKLTEQAEIRPSQFPFCQELQEAPPSDPISSDSRPIYLTFVTSPPPSVFLELFNQLIVGGNTVGGLDLTLFGDYSRNHSPSRFLKEYKQEFPKLFKYFQESQDLTTIRVSTFALSNFLEVVKLYHQEGEQAKKDKPSSTSPLALLLLNNIEPNPNDVAGELTQLLHLRHSHLSQLALVDFETHLLQVLMNGSSFTNLDLNNITSVTISRLFSTQYEKTLMDIKFHFFNKLASCNSLAFLDIDILELNEFGPLADVLLATNLESLRLKVMLSSYGLSHFNSMTQVEDEFSSKFLPALKVSLQNKPLERFSLSISSRFFSLITPIVTTIVQHPTLQRLELCVLNGSGDQQFVPDGNQLLNVLSRSIHEEKQRHLQVLRLQGWCLSDKFFSDIFPNLLSLKTLMVEDATILVHRPFQTLEQLLRAVQFHSVGLKFVVLGFVLSQDRNDSEDRVDDQVSLNILIRELMKKHKDLFLSCNVRLVCIFPSSVVFSLFVTHCLYSLSI
jgi:hypothetical protein